MFYAAEPSLELAFLLSPIACNDLMLFVISCGHYKLWSDSLTLRYPASFTVWYVHLFLCSCSKCAACLNMLLQSQRKLMVFTASMFIHPV